MKTAAPRLETGLSPVVVRGLQIVRAGRVILNDISFTLDKGVFAALVGPSGCGKTSLLRTLALLDKPADGSIQFGDFIYQRQDHRSLVNSTFTYPGVNYVPQTLGLWPHLTIRENILFAAPETTDMRTGFSKLFEQLEIGSILAQKPQSASQGQRQRAALARALLLNPQILLLDEITSALDEKLARRVWEMLRDYTNNGGLILASTHDQNLAAGCDRIYRIRGTNLITETQNNI